MNFNNSLNLSSASSFDRQSRLTLVIPETNRFTNPYEPSVLISQRGQNLINPSIILQGDYINKNGLEENSFLGLLKRESTFSNGKRSNQVVNDFTPASSRHGHQAQQPNTSYFLPNKLISTPSKHQVSPRQNFAIHQPVHQSFEKSSFIQYQQGQGLSLPVVHLGSKVPQGYIPHHKSTPSIGNYCVINDDNGFDKFVEKQNQILNKVLGSIHKQNQREFYQQKIEMEKKRQELEMNRVQKELQIEKLKSKKLEQEIEQRNQNGFMKKEKSNLKDLVISKVQSQSNYQQGNSIIDQSQLLNRSSMNVKRYKNVENKRYKEEDNVGEEEFIKSEELLKREKMKVSLTRCSNQFEDPNKPRNNRQKETKVNSLWRERSQNKFPSKEENLGEVIQVNDKKREGVLKKSKKNKNQINKEEKRVSFEEERKKKAQVRIHALGWGLCFSRILYQEAKSNLFTKREVFSRTISGDIAQAYDLLKNYILQASGKEILEMLTNKQSFGFEGLPSSQIKKSEKIAKEFLDSFKVIFNKLIIETPNLPKILIEIMKPLLQDDSFLPNDYFSAFELHRLLFNTLGKTRDMNAQRGKLLLGGIIIIRVFIYSILMRPWEAFGQSKSKFKEEKLLNLGSILYHATIDIFKASLLVTPNNQSFLSVDLKVHPKKRPLQAIDDIKLENSQRAKDFDKDAGIIEGFYSKNQLTSFFVDNKKLVFEFKALIEGWMNALYEKIQD